MSHVIIYADDGPIAHAKATAAAPELDAKDYPKGFFEHIEANKHLFDDFPSLEEIRADMGTDLPREPM
jgi:hypothetical protein